MKQRPNKTDSILLLVFCWLIQTLEVYGQDTGCRETWIRNSNTHATGGRKYAVVYEEDQCFAVCTARSNCVAVEINTGVYPWECSTFTDRTLLDRSVFSVGYNQYLLTTRCSRGDSDCRDRWELQMSSKANASGTVLPNVDDEQHCLNSCLLNQNCYSVDIKVTTDPIECYVHTNPTDTRSPLYTKDYKLYVLLSRCDRIATEMQSTSTQSNSTPNNPGILYNCWQSINSTHSDDGVQADYYSVDGCMLHCQTSPTCVAIDYDAATSPPCWVHNNAVELLPNNSFPRQSVVQHRFNRTCAVCWTTHRRQHSIFGVQTTDASLNTVDLCQQSCASLPSCVAIDYDQATNPPCWIHNKSADLLPNNTFYSLNATQYRLQRNCSNSESTFSTTTASDPTPWPSQPRNFSACWTYLPRTFSDGGTSAETYSVESCQDHCIGLDGCVAVDYDNITSPPCWIHSDPKHLNKKFVFPKDSVTQYRLNRRCVQSASTAATTSTSAFTAKTFTEEPISQNCWTVLRETSADYGDPVQQVTSVDGCKDYCVYSLTQCVAVDYDVNGDPQCWVHTNLEDLEEENLLKSPNVTQYRLNRTCAEISPGDSFAFNLSGDNANVSIDRNNDTTSPTTTTNAWTLSTPSGGNCAPRWIRFRKQLSLNGVQYPGFQGVAECLDLCLELPPCVAADYDSTMVDGCWLHMDQEDLRKNNTFNPPYSVAQYVVDRTCLGPTSTTAPDCATEWSFSNNTSGAFGLHYFQYRTVADCQGLCVSLGDCLAVDFSTLLEEDSGGCYVYRDAALLKTLYAAPGVQHYGIVGSNCGQYTGVPGCAYEWSDPFNDRNSARGIPTRDVTLVACQSRCVRMASCRGVDVDYNPDPYAFCWLTVIPGSLTSLSGVTHYTLTRTGAGCPEVNTPVDATTVSTVPSTTVCRYFFETSNANANGGVDKGIMTAEQCIASCVDQYPRCVAVDLRAADSRCYHQNSLSGRQWNTCCSRYELVCQTSTCSDTFASYPNTIPSLAGTAQQTIATLDACQSACHGNASCLAFIWARSPRYQGNDCVLSLSTVASTSYSAAYDLYVRQICRQTIPPNGDATFPPTPPSGHCVLDIVLVVDISDTIADNLTRGADNETQSADNLQLLKSFLRGIVRPPIQVEDYFDHVGVVAFESGALVLYDLCRSQTLGEVDAVGIEAIRAPMGETNAPEALRFAYNMLYSTTGCGRPFARKVVLLVTDKQTTLEFRPYYAGSVDALKAKGTTNIAIGVADAVNADDLAYFASTADDVVVLKGFQELVNEEGRTVNRMLSLCERPTVSTRPRVTSPANFIDSTSEKFSGSSVSSESTTAITSTSSSSIATTASTNTSTAATTTTTATTPTTTSTPTSTTATTTTVAATTMTPAHVAHPFGFSASLSGRISAPANPVPTNLVVSNINNSYNASSYSYTTPSNEIYFAEICAGLVAGQPATLSLVQDGRTAMGLTWESKIHNASETICRSGLIQLLPSVTQQLALNSGTVFSDNSETTLSVFSVSDAMSDDAVKRTVHAVGNATFGYTGVIRFRATVGASSGVFNAASSTYTCSSDGLYFVGFTVGSSPFAATRVELDGPKANGEGRTFELTRNSAQHNGITTLSRSVLTPCAAGTKLYLNITYGNVVDYTDYQLITLYAFPYLPRYVPGQAWSLLKDYSCDTLDGPLDPFYFNIVAYNDDGLYNENTRTVTIRTSGYYYVYISTGIGRNNPLFYSLQRNGATLIAINHQTRTLEAEDGVGHGVVVLLNANDVLKVVAAVETYSFSSNRGLQTSFFGMILYGL